jgi:hypothetical protein
MDMLETVDHARGIVEIAQIRFAVTSCFEIHDHWRSPARAHVNAPVTEPHIMFRLLTAEREISRQPVQGTLYQLRRKVQATIRIDTASGRGNMLDDGFRRLRHAHILQYFTHRLVNH